MRVFTFGDSWGAGAELQPKEITFGQIISNHLKVPHLNFSFSGYSLANIMFIMIDNYESITDNDIVLVVIPPDVRWYTMDHRKQFKPLWINTDEWKTTLHDKPIEWFIAHHNLFIYTIYSMLTAKKCRFLLMHNFGRLVIKPQFQSLINREAFLSTKSLTELLTGSDVWENYQSRNWDEDGPDANRFTGKYFAGTQFHPNQLGHYRIAELINEKMKLYTI